MFLYLNETKEGYDELLKKHQDAIFCLNQPKSAEVNSLPMIWRGLVFNIRVKSDEFIHKTQINRDIFTGSLRRIELAYQRLKSADLGSKGQDERENFSLVFFHNAKTFLEVAKKNFQKIFSKEEYEDLYKTVNVIRNYFAHSYEKDFFDQKVVMRIDANHMDNNGLHELEVFDFENSRKIFSIYYSIDLAYFQLKKMAQDINNKI